jgi:hypothetical protein
MEQVSIYRLQEVRGLFRKEILYYSLIEFCIPLRLVTFITKTYGKVRLDKYLCGQFFPKYGLKKGCFVTTAFQLFFMICHLESISKALGI